MAIRVALAEDSFLVREALQQLLRAEPDLDLVAVCADGDELRAAVAEHELDVVVTDIRMPPSMEDEGLRIAAELQRSAPQIGVVVLSAYCDAALATGLLTTGSDRRGYLLKERVAQRAPAHRDDQGRRRRRLGDRPEGRAVAGRRAPAPRAVAAERAQPRSSATSWARWRPARATRRSPATLGLTKRSVEKHINGIFAKLDLDADPDVSRRVTAVVTYLAETGAGAASALPQRRRTPRASRRPRPGTSASP